MKRNLKDFYMLLTYIAIILLLAIGNATYGQDFNLKYSSFQDGSGTLHNVSGEVFTVVLDNEWSVVCLDEKKEKLWSAKIISSFKDVNNQCGKFELLGNVGTISGIYDKSRLIIHYYHTDKGYCVNTYNLKQ